jgi:hypothetical protein
MLHTREDRKEIRDVNPGVNEKFGGADYAGTN